MNLDDFSENFRHKRSRKIDFGFYNIGNNLPKNEITKNTENKPWCWKNKISDNAFITNKFANNLASNEISNINNQAIVQEYITENISQERIEDNTIADNTISEKFNFSTRENTKENTKENTREEIVKSFIHSLQEKIEEKEKNIILVVDRFEGNIAVCENRETGEMININKSELPEEVQEGDVLKIVNNKYEIDAEKQQEIEERIQNKVKDLFEECD